MFVSKWIDVEEKLPENDDVVLVYTSAGKVTTSKYLGDKWKTYNKSIRRWMPMPSAPKSHYGFEFEDDFFGAVINCSIRYACGRQSYMPSLVISVVEPMLPLLSDKTIGCMERDIRDAEKYGGYGDEHIDKPLWLNFLKKLQDVMEERNITPWG